MSFVYLLLKPNPTGAQKNNHHCEANYVPKKMGDGTHFWEYLTSTAICDSNARTHLFHCWDFQPTNVNSRRPYATKPTVGLGLAKEAKNFNRMIVSR
jgi:hypothetical protein